MTDVTKTPNTAPITRPARVHYPAYYLGRPAAWYLAVYSRGKDLRSGLAELAREGTSARSPTTSATIRARPSVETGPAHRQVLVLHLDVEPPPARSRAPSGPRGGHGSGGAVHGPRRQGVEI